MAQGSWLMPRGSWLKAKEKLGVRYYVLRGISLNYWGKRQPVLGEPLGRLTLTDYLLETVRTPKTCLVGEKTGVLLVLFRSIWICNSTVTRKWREENAMCL